MPMNKVKLDICGSHYVVSTANDEDYTLALADRLDRDMNLLLAQNRNASVTTAAVITALGYLDDLEKVNLGTDNMRAQIKDYLEDAAKAKLEVDRAKREIDRLRRELTCLKSADPTPEI